ncbi:hypothetical protein PGTUg99_020464 [Puccinia graminis f. sp. tritici]|uniref:Uncharacterized protein n=1 Tax=Puccinia graminis f. sp. tritici TaxID=56615 RepID=A0A5B0PNB2_PUCGR|nr:hypothetical protein PGTUg99_020464 [Puccinia graminis f. sp. tritici]
MELKFLAPIKLDLAINSATLGIDEPSEAANCNSPAYQQSEIKKPILRVAIVDVSVENVRLGTDVAPVPQPVPHRDGNVDRPAAPGEADSD